MRVGCAVFGTADAHCAQSSDHDGRHRGRYTSTKNEDLHSSGNWRDIWLEFQTFQFVKIARKIMPETLNQMFIFNLG